MYNIPDDTKHRPHEKETFRNKFGHIEIYVGTHENYTNVLGWKTWNNSPPKYLSIKELLLMSPTQVLWPLYKSNDFSTNFMKYLSIIGYHFIIINIFLDMAYDLSTYLFRSYLSTNKKNKK